MTIEIALVLVLVAVALFLFASQALPLDVAALAIMTTTMLVPLVGTPVVETIPWLRERDIDLDAAFPTVQEGLSGLSSEATITVLAMFILSAGVQRSGVMHVLGRAVMPFVGDSELRLFFVVMPAVGVVSGVINNTAAVAVAIPFVLDLCRRLDLQASRLLMPLSFFGMLGGMLTLVGTSTNILASTLVSGDDALGRTIGMFEFSAVGAIVLVTGLVYFALIGRFLLPDRDLGGDQDAEQEFVIELAFPPGSPWLDRRLGESGLAERHGLTVTRVVRDGESIRGDDIAAVLVGPDDVVKVRATARQVAELIASDDVDVLTDARPGTIATGRGVLVRALVRNRLLFTGRRARTLGFDVRYHARLVGIETQHTAAPRLADELLTVGEILLLEVEEDELPTLRRHPDLVLLTEFDDEFDRRRMWLTSAIVLAVVGVAAFTSIPIVVTALIGVIAMAVTDCVTATDLYSGVQWEVVFLLAGVIPLGIAMSKSGGADWLGGLLADAVRGWPLLLVLIALYVFTTLLTEVVSNNASVVILVPVAISLSADLGIALLPLVLIVMFAASTSFLSPVGYQTNAMVYGTGLYRFTDFARVGAPLNLVLALVTSTAIWAWWV